MALSAFAGPVPEPVLPILSFRSPLESCARWVSSMMPQCLSMNARPVTLKFEISSLSTFGSTTTPGPIITLASLFRNPLGSILTLYTVLPSFMVCPALGPAPPRTIIFGLSLIARYEIIFPLPSSPKNPPTTTVDAIL